MQEQINPTTEIVVEEKLERELEREPERKTVKLQKSVKVVKAVEAQDFLSFDPALLGVDLQSACKLYTAKHKDRLASPTAYAMSNVIRQIINRHKIKSVPVPKHIQKFLGQKAYIVPNSEIFKYIVGVKSHLFPNLGNKNLGHFHPVHWAIKDLTQNFCTSYLYGKVSSLMLWGTERQFRDSGNLFVNVEALKKIPVMTTSQIKETLALRIPEAKSKAKPEAKPKAKPLAS